MITRHPYRAVGVVLAVLLVSGFTAGMIGQYNDGPWGGAPQWLGTASYSVFLGSVLAVVLLSAYLAVQAYRYRRARSAHA